MNSVNLVSPMAASSIASPLHTSLVASSTSALYEKDHPMMASFFQSSKIPSHWAQRKTFISKQSKNQEHYNISRGLNANLAVFGDNALLFFGSRTASITARPNRLMKCDANSGIFLSNILS